MPGEVEWVAVFSGAQIFKCKALNLPMQYKWTRGRKVWLEGRVRWTFPFFPDTAMEDDVWRALASSLPSTGRPDAGRPARPPNRPASDQRSAIGGERAHSVGVSVHGCEHADATLPKMTRCFGSELENVAALLHASPTQSKSNDRVT